MSTRERAELLIEARWLLPIAPANTALADHAVAVSAGRIVAIGPATQLRTRFEIREHVVRERSDGNSSGRTRSSGEMRHGGSGASLSSTSGSPALTAVPGSNRIAVTRPAISGVIVT